MTNKDCLEYILKNCICFGGDKAIIDVDTIKRTLKDLEVLEILKNHYRFNKNINEDLLVLKKPIVSEDAEKIKQWLEDK